jgi:hypothetical protein
MTKRLILLLLIVAVVLNLTIISGEKFDNVQSTNSTACPQRPCAFRQICVDGFCMDNLQPLYQQTADRTVN